MKTKNSFLASKIAQLGTALFYCENQDILPFSIYLVEALPTEDECIWVLVTKRSNQLISYNSFFGARLEFYRKGHFFSVSIEGTCSVVAPKDIPAHLESSLKQKAKTGKLLIKIQIEKAVYRDLIQETAFLSMFSINTRLKNLVDTGLQQWQLAGKSFA